MPPTSKKGELWIALSGGIVLLTSFGTVYSMAVLFPRIQADLTVPPWHLAAYFSAAGTIYFGIGVFSGALTDRLGARCVVAVGQGVLALGLVVASMAGSEAWLALGYVVGIGLGVGLTYVPVTSGVQSLCTGRGTIAAGIAATGVGVGALLLPPAVASVSTTFDWRLALQALAAVACVAPIAALPLRLPAARTGAIPTRFRPTREFVTLYVAQMLAATVAFVPFAHIVSYALTSGLSYAQGVMVLGGVGTGSIVGRVAVGAIGARAGVYRTSALCAGAMTAAMLALAASRAPWNMEAAMLVFGAAYGGFNSLLGPIAIEASERANVGRAIGILSTSRALGILLGPWLVGMAAWSTGSFVMPFIGCACVAATSALLLSSLAGRTNLTSATREAA